jgi:DNA-binding NtrC family response regulator
MSQSQPILIVDDEPNVRLVFGTALESAGYAVEEAEDGLAALRKLRERDYALILLDLRMPGLDGMETLRRMRAEHLDVPVIMITAHGSVPDAVEAMKLGAIDFVSKPVTPRALCSAVDELLARHRESDSAAGADPRAVLTRAKREINRRQFEAAAQLIASLRSIDELEQAEAHYLRGLLLEMRGKEADAFEAYRKALEADPSYEAAALQLKDRGSSGG